MRGILYFSWLLVGACLVAPGSNDTSEDTTGDDDDDGNFPQSQPFSDDELVYLTYTDGEYDSVRVIDTTTGESRELTDLEGGFGLSSVEMAPDRRSVAFAAYFRLEEGDISPGGGLPHPGIWRVDTSGEHFEPIAPPLQQMESSASCASDSDCAPLGMECNLTFGTCQLEAASFTTNDLTFSPSGDELWFTYGTYWLDGYYLAGGTTLASVPSKVGHEATVPEIHLSDGSCTQLTDLAMHPDGGSLLGLQSVCLNNKDDGVFDFTLPGLDASRMIPTPRGFDVTLTNPDWYPDGHGFVFVINGGWDEDGDGEEDWFSDGLVQYDLATDEVTLITAMPEGYAIIDPTVSPDGAKIAMCVTGAGAGSDLYLIDLEAWTQEPLTEHGASCKASW